MFSGIIESHQPILSITPGKQSFRIEIKKPIEFTDINVGDSIAVNGVCLTIENWNETSFFFTMAAETLRVLKWNPDQWLGRSVNLERSLRFGDRIHGHLVTGHVEGLALLKKYDQQGDNLFLDVEVPENLLPFFWQKGSITLNGVSLTINQISNRVISVCLIPETQKRTSLPDLKEGDWINVEPDYMAKAIVRALETGVIQNAK